MVAPCKQLLREANLRYSLVRLRENAESIAFFQGEAQEAAVVSARLSNAVENRRKVIGTERNLEFFTVAYKYLVQILPVLVVSPLYFAGSIELGVITQSTGAFNNVLNDLSIVINQFESISAFSAGLGRLSTFVERMESYQDGDGVNSTFVVNAAQVERLNLARPKQRSLADYVLYGQMGPPEAAETAEDDVTAAKSRSVWNYVMYGQMGAPAPPAPPVLAPSTLASARSGSRIRNVEVAQLADGHVMSVKDLSLLTPDGSRQLFANVTVEVMAGQHLLIMGNSGTGKSSMLRAVAGLWDRGSGEVTRPLVSQTMFLPQRPYATLGSLRQQLVYPQRVDEWQRYNTDESLLRALREVQLGRLAEGGKTGLDDVRDWGDELSLGEQQRLAFARVIVNKPKLAILDEATSALDLANEAIMYEALAKLPGITYLSVGHRPSLMAFHSNRLRLFGMEQPSGRRSYALETIVQEEAVVESLEQSLAL